MHTQMLAGAVFRSGNVPREGCKAGDGVVSLNLSRRAIPTGSAEVDSVNGDFGPGFLGLHRSVGVVGFVESGLQCHFVFEDGGGRAVLSVCENGLG